MKCPGGILHRGRNEGLRGQVNHPIGPDLLKKPPD